MRGRCAAVGQCRVAVLAAQWAVLTIGCWLAASAAGDPTVLHPYPCELPELGENDRNGWTGGGRRNGDVLAMGEQVRVQYNASDSGSWKSIHIAACNVVNCTLLRITGALNGSINYFACSGTSGNIFGCAREIRKRFISTSGAYFRTGDSIVFVVELRPGSVAVWVEDYPEGAVVIDLEEGEDQLRIGTNGGPWAFQTESPPSQLSLLSPALPAGPRDKLCVLVEYKGPDPHLSTLTDSEEKPVVLWEATRDDLHPLRFSSHYGRAWKATLKAQVLVPVPHPAEDMRWRLQVSFPSATNVHSIQPCGCHNGQFYMTTTPRYPTTQGSHPTTESWYPSLAGWHPPTERRPPPTERRPPPTTASPTRSDWYPTTSSYPTTNGRLYSTTGASYPTTTEYYSDSEEKYPTTARSYLMTTTTTTTTTTTSG